MKRTKNVIAMIYRGLAIFLLATGIIWTIYTVCDKGSYYDEEEYTEYSDDEIFEMFLTYCGSSLGLFAISEIIQLLQDIRDGYKKKPNEINELTTEQITEAQQKVDELFKD